MLKIKLFGLLYLAVLKRDYCIFYYNPHYFHSTLLFCTHDLFLVLIFLDQLPNSSPSPSPPSSHSYTWPQLRCTEYFPVNIWWTGRSVTQNFSGLSLLSVYKNIIWDALWDITVNSFSIFQTYNKIKIVNLKSGVILSILHFPCVWHTQHLCFITLSHLSPPVVGYGLYRQ